MIERSGEKASKAANGLPLRKRGTWPQNACVCVCMHYDADYGEARLAEWLRRRGASPGVLGSIPGAGNSLAARYRPLSKAVKCKSNASS